MRLGTIIPIRGRHNRQSCKLKKAGKNKFTATSTEGSIRFGGTPDILEFIDFDGGPFIEVGTIMSDLHPVLPYEKVSRIESTGKEIVLHTEQINQTQETTKR